MDQLLQLLTSLVLIILGMFLMFNSHPIASGTFFIAGGLYVIASKIPLNFGDKQ